MDRLKVTLAGALFAALIATTTVPALLAVGASVGVAAASSPSAVLVVEGIGAICGAVGGFFIGQKKKNI